MNESQNKKLLDNLIRDAFLDNIPPEPIAEMQTQFQSFRQGLAENTAPCHFNLLTFFLEHRLALGITAVLCLLIFGGTLMTQRIFYQPNPLLSHVAVATATYPKTTARSIKCLVTFYKDEAKIEWKERRFLYMSGDKYCNIIVVCNGPAGKDKGGEI